MPYSDEEMDSLHVLPLAVIPLETRGLQSASLVKNSQLRSVVELFAGERTGSGQIEIADLGLEFASLKDPDHPDMMLIQKLEQRGLQSASLVKNSQLRSVVELFAGERTGSGQIEIADLGLEFASLKDPDHPDMMLIQKLEQLRSYDVYSLRITFREQRIPLKNQDALRLSSAKETALASFMSSFTQSLMKRIFAPTPISDDDEIELMPLDENDFDTEQDASRSLSKLINPSDPDIIHANLADLAKRLEIRLDELPKMLEDFADIHLSVAYYEDCYGDVMSEFDELIALVARLIRSNRTFQRDTELLKKCDRIEYDITAAKRFFQEHLMVFNKLENEFWSEVSARRLREIEDVAKANHTQLGGILCGMTVKMNSWRKKFPTPERITPHRVAAFVMSELGEGIGNIYDAA